MDGETQDPEFLDGLRARATRFAIDFGESQALRLEVMERRQAARRGQSKHLWIHISQI